MDLGLAHPAAARGDRSPCSARNHSASRLSVVGGERVRWFGAYWPRRGSQRHRTEQLPRTPLDRSGRIHCDRPLPQVGQKGRCRPAAGNRWLPRQGSLAARSVRRPGRPPPRPPASAASATSAPRSVPGSEPPRLRIQGCCPALFPRFRIVPPGRSPPDHVHKGFSSALTISLPETPAAFVSGR